MSRRFSRDHIEILHDYGLFVPTRTIVMDQGALDEETDNTVNFSMANRLIKNLTILDSISKDDITIIVNTEGGDEYQGMAIYDAVRALKDTHVTIEIHGCAQSMGCIMLQAADRRVLMPNAALMFHTGSTSTGDYHPDEMLAVANFNYRYGIEVCDRIIYNRLLEKNPKLSWKKFRQVAISSRYMLADEAVAIGLADEVKR